VPRALKIQRKQPPIMTRIGRIWMRHHRRTRLPRAAADRPCRSCPQPSPREAKQVWDALHAPSARRMARMLTATCAFLHRRPMEGARLETCSRAGPPAHRGGLAIDAAAPVLTGGDGAAEALYARLGALVEELWRRSCPSSRGWRARATRLSVALHPSRCHLEPSACRCR
jgi:hypothetical protein